MNLFRIVVPLALTLFVACTTPTKPRLEPQPTPVGTPIGAPVSAVIGTADNLQFARWQCACASAFAKRGNTKDRYDSSTLFVCGFLR